ncbi:MAG: co-chaperone YbbN [Proteobacteria bacterium]|nr:co-chaperone YbbN [Pseudomonadota bacterium]
METIIGAGKANGGEPPAGLIKDSDTAGFAQDVIETSMTTPVIVDFWAPWCGPCKQLTPALEKTVQAARGAVRLVKVNIDENQELAAQLRIQSVPAVYAFFKGQPVDGFVGAQSESQVKAFVDRLASQAGAELGPSPVDQALEQAQAALESGQPAAASALFGQVLQHEPDNETALAGLIRCHLDAGDAAAARQMFDSLPEDKASAAAFASIKAALELAEQSAETGEIPELEARVAAQPNDHQARFDLAMARHAAGEREAAVEALIEIIGRDRNWNEEAARHQLLKFFEAWGPKDELTQSARRRLSSLLFS